jgi:hypothetical protein
VENFLKIFQQNINDQHWQERQQTGDGYISPPVPSLERDMPLY